MTILLLEWVFTSAFLIVTLLALRAALGRRISARLRYALWAVVLVRLLVPVQLFTSPIAGTWVITEKRAEETVYTPVSRGEDAALRDDGPTIVANTKPEEASGPVLSVPAASTVPDAPSLPEPPAAPDLTKAPAWLGWMWLGGGTAAALVMLCSNLRFSRRLRRRRVIVEGADCPLPVYAAEGLPSPCLFGLLRPAVYVTPEAAASPAMLRHVIAHEYTHFRHGDHWWSLLRCAALAAHWWNPLVWLAVCLSRRDGELACDEGALRRLGDGERAAYGKTLLTLVTAKPRPGDLLCFATTMAGDKSSLKERITRIAQAPKRWLWAAVAVVLVTALACACAFGQKAEDSGPPTGEDVSLPAADLSFSIDENGNVDIQGTVDGLALEDGTYWQPSGAPAKTLTMRYAPFTNGIEGSFWAYWEDGNREAVTINTSMMAALSSYHPSGYWVFTVDLSGETGVVTRMDAQTGTAPEGTEIRMFPTTISDEEAVRAARIAAKLLTAAEDYYKSQSAPAETDDVPEVELAFSHTLAEPWSSYYVPQDVLDAVQRWVAGEFAWDAPGGVMTGVWEEYNQDTGKWETHGDPDLRAQFDRVRVNGMMGPWGYDHGNVEYAVWRINYEYHTTTPDVVRDGKFLQMAGGRYLDGDGWMGPTYPNSTYLIFKLAQDSDGSGLADGSTYAGSVVIPDCDPFQDTERFHAAIEEALYPEPERGEPPEGAFDHASTVMFYNPDLNRNGVEETIKIAEIPGDYIGPARQSEGQRIGVFEGGELIWWDEGYFAHAGYNAIYSCTLDGQDYLLRYNPVMYQGYGTYSYKLFTLEDGVETAVEQDSVEFNMNVDRPDYTAGEFDPEAIDAFMAKVNYLLNFSTVLMMTDSYLSDAIEAGHGLTDQLWWLDGWEPVFVRDENKTLYGNLCAYLAAMEPYSEPTVRALDGDDGALQLSYHGQHKRFKAPWDQWFQPNAAPRLADLDGDGKDEIVVILNMGHGTGYCEEGLYVFDGETLGQYDTSALTQDLIAQVSATGDQENFYLSAPGMERVSVPKGVAGLPETADALGLGDIVYYGLENGRLVCTLGCDASGRALAYVGYVHIALRLDGQGLRAVEFRYEPEPEYGVEEYLWKEGFRQVLLSEEQFTLVDAGGRVTQSKKYLSGFSSVEEFAPVELENGERAVVLKTIYANDKSEELMFLFQKDGVVYGTPMVYSEMGEAHNRAYDVKVDGTLVLHDSPGMDGEAVSMSTESMGFVVKTSRRATGECLADGQPATEEEYRAAMEQAMAKKDAFWYRFREDTINKVFA